MLVVSTVSTLDSLLEAMTLAELMPNPGRFYLYQGHLHGSRLTPTKTKIQSRVVGVVWILIIKFGRADIKIKTLSRLPRLPRLWILVWVGVSLEP